MTRAQLAKTLENTSMSLEGPSDTFLRQIPTLLECEGSKCVKTAPGAWGTGPFNIENPECCTSPRREDEPIAKFSIHPTTDESKLNKTERAYLAHLRMLGYPWIGVQNITLKLCDDCRYLPDFSVISANGEMEFHETKGFMRPQALVKLKVAARSFPMFRFIVVRRVKGGWTHSPVKP